MYVLDKLNKFYCSSTIEINLLLYKPLTVPLLLHPLLESCHEVSPRLAPRVRLGVDRAHVVGARVQVLADDPVRVVEAPRVHGREVAAEEPAPVGHHPPAGPHTLVLHPLPLERHTALKYFIFFINIFKDMKEGSPSRPEEKQQDGGV